MNSGCLVEKFDDYGNDFVAFIDEAFSSIVEIKLHELYTYIVVHILGIEPLKNRLNPARLVKDVTINLLSATCLLLILCYRHIHLD